MSLALNHVRGLSGVPLRAAQLAGRQCCKAHRYGDNSFANCAGLPRSTPGGIRRLFRSQATLRYPEPLATDPKVIQEQKLHPQDPSTSRSDEVHDPKSQQSSEQDASNQTQPDTLMSRRRLKKSYGQPNPTPSQYLAKALRQTGHPLGNHHLGSQDVDAVRHLQALQPTYGRPARLSLQTTLGEYIRLVDPLISSSTEAYLTERLDSALSEVFRDNSYRYLTTRGYDVGDVVAWAWVLKSKDANQAIPRLFAHAVQHQSKSRSESPIAPPFLILFLLKQPYLEARSLRLLLIYSLHLISGQPLPCEKMVGQSLQENLQLPSGKFQSKVDHSTGMRLFARLIRHARIVWPQAMPTIASAFSRFMIATKPGEAEDSILKKSNADRLKTKNFNIFLRLLSVPSRAQPFQSTPLQQQAQFELLRAMASHKPVLPLTRKGYRAVAAIQLAHKKTSEERQSAELKAPSWPPWKEGKLGIDALRGNEGMYSRAMNVLSQMRDAGYSSKLWEDVCSILAGWDTDRSPTIQTRGFMRWSRTLSRASHTSPDHTAIWTARIRATRTVREAWACFLSYQDRDLPPNAAIYTEMAEKLIYRQLAIKNRFDESDHILPGDGREVYAEPASARDIIYVHTEPPVLQDFLEQMTSQGLRFPSRLLALLLRMKPDFRTGLQYLIVSDLTKDQIKVLCTVLGHSSDYEAQSTGVLQTVPDGVFASFIKFICVSSSSTLHAGPKSLTLEQFPFLATERQPRNSKTVLPDFEDHPRQGCHPRAFWHATQLVKARQTPCTPAWTHILSALGSTSSNYLKENKAWRRVIAWHEALLALKWMKDHDIEPSLDGFHAMCKVFNEAVNAGLKHPDEAEEAFNLVQKATHGAEDCEVLGHEHFDAMVENGLLVLKSQFDSLVLPASSASKLAEQSIFTENSSIDSQLQVPTILHVPSFAILHRFVRVLGAVGDDGGVVHLLQWMSRSAVPLNAAADERLNGEKMRRQTLAAVRVTLERLQAGPTDCDRIASDPAKVQEAYDIISQTPGWDWPSDEEVEDYCR
ncbi:uncharacterized protein N7496_001657 [Penicillium cataractarum]|uniref:Uncharacterized protein n=1 Tax=Penicillium cataractarum TaxID=2100454 RepID=A0A9X0B734_9EURO|nr:uncharacterized protein N7496_001657 [Penicillium cataractarum]KAJ5390589.1 hypothetical protein N7496_001657 [Penicillium cataractarum]